jgi:hypothetical protein
MNSQSLDCRLESVAAVAAKVAPWEEARNANRDTCPLDLHRGGRPPETEETLPISRRLTAY